METCITRINLTIAEPNQTIIGLKGRTRITNATQIQLMHLLNGSTRFLTIPHREGSSTRSINLRNDIQSLNVVGDLLSLRFDIGNTRLKAQELAFDNVLVRLNERIDFRVALGHHLQELRHTYHNQVRIARFIHIELLKLRPVSGTTEQGILRDITSRLQIVKHIELSHISSLLLSSRIKQHQRTE